MRFKYIGFDADDTLWVNEPFFREAEERFCALLKDYGELETLTSALFKTEIKNIELYGYGIKGFVLSMIETGMQVSNGSLSNAIVGELIEIGKAMLSKPVELLDGIEQVLHELKSAGYKLIVATKGDLLDQERKLQKSNLEKYFHHIEIMSDKKEYNYKKLLAHLEIEPDQFLMVGNSLKSDILPVLTIGGYGIHIPFHTTWVHEHIENMEKNDRFWEVDTASHILPILLPQ